MSVRRKTHSVAAQQPDRIAEAAITAYASSGSDGTFGELFRHTPQPMWLYDLATLRFLKVNEAAIDRYGYAEHEFLAMRLEDIRPREDVDRLHAHVDAQRAKRPGGEAKVSDYWRHTLKSGQTIWVDIYEQIFDYEGRDVGLVIAADVTDRKMTQDRLDIQRAYFRQLFDSSSDAIALLDAHDIIVDANQRFLKLFGYELSEVLGRRVEHLIVPDSRQHEIGHSWDTICHTGYLYRETCRQRKDGSLFDVAVSGYPIMFEAGRIGTYLIYRDLTERRRLQEKVRYHSTHHAVTGLINRKEFERRVAALLEQPGCRRSAHALLHTALDQFTLVNQVCGHDAGEQLLKLVTARIKSCAGASVVAHLYGDEFGVLLSDVQPDDARLTARRIIADIGAITFRWDDHIYKIGANIGGAFLDASAGDVRTALSVAEMACHVAKEKGANRMHIAATDDQETVRRQHEAHWLSEIHDALDNNRFVLYGQQILPVSGDVEGEDRDYEILVRMLDRQNNLVAPGQFIPIAERFRLMGRIDRQVFDRLFKALDEVLTRGGHIKGKVSVNISGETFGDEEFHDYIKAQFARHTVSPHHFCFEVTETAAIQNISAAKQFVAEMQSMGAKIALDDFGSGMSSFRYLRELPIDYLKIDGLFIRDLTTNDTDRAMTEAICRMAQRLGIRTIAEYVEDAATLECLRELGVDYAQGFGIHRPEPWFVQFVADI